jgi:NHS family xanthosine MFS transporter
MLTLKNRLTVMNFLQFFIWGAWLITIANYWFETKKWSPSEFGAIFSTLGFSSLFMPTLMGILADRWINVEKLYALLHILGGLLFAYIPFVIDSTTFFWIIFFAMMCYMPTISLANSISYSTLKNNNFDIIKDFPPIRFWGTIGFIAAMWVTNLSGNKASSNQFFIAAISGILLGIYAIALPKLPSEKLKTKNSNFIEIIGLDAIKLFKSYKMVLFFMFSMLLGAALQLTNMYGDVYLSEFKNIDLYKNLWVVEHSTLIMSISQVSETLFILAIPFFLKRFGIKRVMLISMFAWVLRFGLLAYGNPAEGLWMIIVSCIVYGMAFDFFNVSGSLFIETTTSSSIRSSAQGLFMMMTNGVGAILGSFSSGFIIEKYYKLSNGSNDWKGIWLLFAGYALIVALIFALFFKHKHDPKEVVEQVH